MYIEASSLADITYTIHDEKKTIAAHAEFTIVTQPNDHRLCGLLTYEAFFDDSAVDGDPLTYDAVTRVFSVESNDGDLIGSIF